MRRCRGVSPTSSSQPRPASRPATGPNDAGLSRQHLIAACEASLRRLGRDHIDLYQVHEWDGQTPLEETLGALDALVRSGKVRYIGCSNFAGWQLMKAAGVAQRRGFEPFVAQQIYLSLQSRDAEHEVMPAAIDLGLGTLVWSPLAGGLLSGKYRRGATPEGAARHVGDWNEPPIYDHDRLYDTIDAIVEIASHARCRTVADRSRLAARAPGRDVARHRRQDARATRRESRCGRRAPDAGGSRRARAREPYSLALSALASGRQCRRSPLGS